MDTSEMEARIERLIDRCGWSARMWIFTRCVRPLVSITVCIVVRNSYLWLYLLFLCVSYVCVNLLRCSRVVQPGRTGDSFEMNLEASETELVTRVKGKLKGGSE
jgi:hypothetical protein